MDLNNGERALLARIDADRLTSLALELVGTPSPTGREGAVAALLARRLAERGLDVETDREFPESPTIIARLRGAELGPTLQFDGHTDTVPLPHAPPALRDGILHGRGAADMKGGLAAIAEAITVLSDAGLPREGGILFTAHGLHEAPDALGDSVRALVRRGVLGDAVIVGEGASDRVPVAGKGMSIFEVTLHRQGPTVHEVCAPPGTSNLVLVGSELAQQLRRKAEELAAGNEDPLVGRETLFLGAFQCGEFYNQVADRCFLTGAWRYPAPRTADAVADEFRALLGAMPLLPDVQVNARCFRVRDSYAITPDTPIVAALRSAYHAVTGRDLPLAGGRSVNDAPIFVREGGVPAVCHGPAGAGAHAHEESVPIAELVRAARVYLLAAMRYLSE